MADRAGLRGLIGAGHSRVSLSAAMRVRDSGRPDAAELAAAEAEIERRLAARPAVVPARRGPSPTAGQPIRTRATQTSDAAARPEDGRVTPTPGDVAARGAQGSRAQGSRAHGSRAQGSRAQGSDGSSPSVS